MKKIIFSMLVMCIGTLFAFAETEKCEKAGQKEYKSEEGCDYKTRTCCGTPGSKNLYWSGWNEECKPPKICMHYCKLGGATESYEDKDEGELKVFYGPDTSGLYRCKKDLESKSGVNYGSMPRQAPEAEKEISANPRRYSHPRPDGTCDKSLWWNFGGSYYVEEECRYEGKTYSTNKDYWTITKHWIDCDVSLIDESMIVRQVEVDKDVFKWQCSALNRHTNSSDQWDRYILDYVEREVQGRRCDATVTPGGRCTSSEGSHVVNVTESVSVGTSSCLLGKEGSTYLCTCVYTGREKVLEDVPVIMLN